MPLELDTDLPHPIQSGTWAPLVGTAWCLEKLMVAHEKMAHHGTTNPGDHRHDTQQVSLVPSSRQRMFATAASENWKQEHNQGRNKRRKQCQNFHWTESVSEHIGTESIIYRICTTHCPSKNPRGNSGHGNASGSQDPCDS